MLVFSTKSAFVQVLAVGSILLASSGITVSAFVPRPTAYTNTLAPNPIPFPTDSRYHHPTTQRNAIIPYESTTNALSTATNLILSDNAQAIVAATSSLETLRTIVIDFGALVVGVGVLDFVTAAFIMPKAAERLDG